jgi:hypothetical protein
MLLKLVERFDPDLYRVTGENTLGDLASNLWTGVESLVPEGRNDRSQAIYCLECATQRTRPVGNGMIRSTGRFSTVGGEYVV